MIGHDQLTKDLFQTFFTDLLQIVVPEFVPHMDLEKIRFLRGEHFTDLPRGQERRLDLVAEVNARRGSPTPILVHVEPENKARSKTPERLWCYKMQLKLRHGHRVISIVVYRRGGQPGVVKKTLREKLFGHELSTFSYFAFGLSGAKAEDYLARPEPLAWALAAQMRARHWSKAQHRLECLRPIAKAPVDDARRFLLANFVEAYVELDRDEEAEYKALLAEKDNQEVAAMELTWADKIELRGEQKGMQEMLFELIEERFGVLSEGIRRRIEAISSKDELRRLARRVLVARSWEELELP